MAFRLDKLTVKSQEAVQRAQSLAGGEGPSGDGPAAPAGGAARRDRTASPGRSWKRSASTCRSSSKQVNAELDRKPQVSGGSQPQPNRQLMAVLEAAHQRSGRDEGRVRLGRASAAGPDARPTRRPRTCCRSTASATRTSSKPSSPSAAAPASPTRTPRASIRPCKNTASTWCKRPTPASSIRSSAATTKSAA